jgi:hypothetical protein
MRTAEATPMPIVARRRIFLWQVVRVIKIREYPWHQFRAGTLNEESSEFLTAPLPITGSANTRRC